MTHPSKFEEMLGRQFDWHGEATRMQFFKTWLAAFVLSVLYALPVLWFLLTFDDPTEGAEAAVMLFSDEESGWVLVTGLILWQLIGVWLLTGMLVMMLMTASRRLAHMGWSRWWILASEVPLVNILFFFTLLFWPGKRGRKSGTEDKHEPALDGETQ